MFNRLSSIEQMTSQPNSFEAQIKQIAIAIMANKYGAALKSPVTPRPRFAPA
jgi:hypothetical protein